MRQQEQSSAAPVQPPTTAAFSALRLAPALRLCVSRTRKIALTALAVLFLSFCFFPPPRCAPPAKHQELRADLEGDGRCEELVLAGQGSHSLTIWRGGEKVWQGIPRRWRAWKLQVADVDGDGVKEIIIGVHKPTRFFPKPHNCLFVFGWEGEQALPKWLGSRLSKPFDDFIFAQLDGEAGEELVSLEVTRGGRRCLVVYSWCGFGFVGEWQSREFARARLSRSEAGSVRLALSNGKCVVLARKGESYVLENP